MGLNWILVLALLAPTLANVGSSRRASLPHQPLQLRPVAPSLQQQLPLPPLPGPVILLLRLNSIGLCTFLGHVLGRQGGNGTKTLLHFGCSLDNMRRGRYYTLVTSQLMHAAPLHYLGNMLALCSIGPIVHSCAGTRRFLVTVAAATISSPLAGLAYQQLLGRCGRQLRKRKAPKVEPSPWPWFAPWSTQSKGSELERLKRKFDDEAVERLAQSGARPAIGFSGVISAFIPSYFVLLRTTRHHIMRQLCVLLARQRRRGPLSLLLACFGVDLGVVGAEERHTLEAQLLWVTMREATLVQGVTADLAMLAITPLSSVSSIAAHSVASSQIG